MADPTTEKLQSMNIQEFEGSEFDPLSSVKSMETDHQNGLDLMDCGMNGQTDKQVSFDQGLPDPGFMPESEGQFMNQGQGQARNLYSRNMSDGEILGYQNEYGESSITGQHEYYGDEENNLVDFGDGANAEIGGQGHFQQTSQNVPQIDVDDQSSSNYNDEYIENDYVPSDEYSDNVGGQGDTAEETFDSAGAYGSDEPVPENWHPDMSPDRRRRSRSPDRSVSPRVDSDNKIQLMSPERRRRSVSPERSVSPPRIEPDNQGDQDTDLISSPSEYSQADQAEGYQIEDLRSQSSQPGWSETESLDSRSETEGGTPRRSKMPKPKMKRPLELPPWNDNVVIPPLPRAKPTMIGKQADIPPPSPQKLRPKTAPARTSHRDASSDSGVEDDKAGKSPVKSSGIPRKYGVDSNNMQYKPGGGNVQVFSQKVVNTKEIKPRTDTTRPRSAMSPRPTRKESPLSPKPSPNTKFVQSKIGSLANTKHVPGGGNVKVLDAKVDFTNVSSKVGSKDKIHHKPAGGDKKIESQKLAWKTESRVGSMKNASHSPGGGNVKILDQKVEVKAQAKVGSTANLKHKPGGGDKKIETQKLEFKESAKPKVGSMDKVKHKPGGGDVRILDEKVDFTEKAKPKVGSMDKVKHTPGGGDKKIETQKLKFKESARARTDTGANSGEKQRSRSSTHSRSESVTSSQDGSQSAGIDDSQ
ncbi:microtubule-associated protein tau-like isoform X2 [Mya arenaria]|uniref:microtubule-associated protein tau-like isoform X2 n=1 Tax=Mya arenaria TaxID=6604 RepID=UPI0022E8B6EC|nr:microtubule-associated protein tau-like isoform X2 [Mya arenaria]